MARGGEHPHSGRQLRRHVHHVFAGAHEPFGDVAADPGAPLDRPDPNSDGWVVIGLEPGLRQLAFQRAAEWVAPRWPDPAYPQQLHLDIRVSDADEAEQELLALGATRVPLSRRAGSAGAVVTEDDAERVAGGIGEDPETCLAFTSAEAMRRGEPVCT